MFCEGLCFKVLNGQSKGLVNQHWHASALLPVLFCDAALQIDLVGGRLVAGQQPLWGPKKATRKEAQSNTARLFPRCTKAEGTRLSANA